MTREETGFKFWPVFIFKPFLFTYLCLTAYILVCARATFTGCTSRPLLSRWGLIPHPHFRPFSSLCSSSCQPDSHRSPAQMPWPTLHVCMSVNQCVFVHLLLALSRTASQSIRHHPPTHLCLLSHHPSCPSFLFLPVFNIPFKSSWVQFHTGKGGYNYNIVLLCFSLAQLHISA